MDLFSYAPTLADLPNPPQVKLAQGEELGCIIRLDRGFPVVLGSAGLERAEHSVGFVQAKDEQQPTIGDWVAYQSQGEHDKAKILRILPRKNALKRYKHAQNASLCHILAANIDAVLFVQPLSRDLSDFSQIGRAYVMAKEANVPFTILFSKADLLTVAERNMVYEHFTRVFSEIDALFVDKEGLAKEAVEAQLTPHTITVLLGESGAGKSTLVNTLLGEALLETQEVSKKQALGRHTTVCRRMIALPDAGVVVDAPGIRNFSICGLHQGFSRAFSDIEAYAKLCKFRNCSHKSEAGCAVQQAFVRGVIPSERFELYKQLSSEL